MTALCRIVIAPRQLTRALSLSVGSFKQIKHVETEKKIVVEGVMEDVNVKNTDLAVGPCGSRHQCHPFCKSPIVKDVKHTDVLILDQFVDSKGQMYSKEDLKICNVSCSFIFITEDYCFLCFIIKPSGRHSSMNSSMNDRSNLYFEY